MDFEELRLRVAAAEDIVELAAALLRFCRRHADAYREAQNDFAVRANETLLAWTGHTRLSHLSEDLEDEDCRLVLELLDRSSLPPVVRARALAVALDDVVGQRFHEVFEASDPRTRVLAPGAPIPVKRLKPGELFASLNTPPERLSPAVDRLPHLRLAPEDLRGFEVVLDFESPEMLGPARESTFATCHANVSHDEFTVDGPAPPDSFFGYRPRDSAKQGALVVQLLKTAGVAGARIVLFPELCMAPETSRQLLAEQPAAPIRLVLAGSHHVELDGKRRNQSMGVLRGRPTSLRHWKFNPFHSPRLGRKDIYLGTRGFTVYFSGGWSLVAMICKDFLDEDARWLLQQLGVNLLLLPSMTESVEQFQAFADALADASQTTVLLANTPQVPSGVHALLAVPERGVQPLQVGNSDGRAPGVGLFRRTDEGWRAEWIDLEQSLPNT